VDWNLFSQTQLLVSVLRLGNTSSRTEDCSGKKTKLYGGEKLEECSCFNGFGCHEELLQINFVTCEQEYRYNILALVFVVLKF